jgi:hypothetical protein
MHLLISEVTEMHGGNYCVAGWRAQTQSMIRPLPDGSNWTQALLNAFGVVPGATISVIATGQQHQSSFPHRTEDTIVGAGQIANIQPGPINWFGPAAPAVAPNVSTAFGGLVQHNSVWNGVLRGVHVPINANGPSLGGVSIPRANLGFVVEFDKLKATLNDGLATYKLPVSSASLKEAWRQGGVAAAFGALPQVKYLHIRLGLARAFGNPADKCYMMLNGVHG